MLYAIPSPIRQSAGSVHSVAEIFPKIFRTRYLSKMAKFTLISIVLIFISILTSVKSKPKLKDDGMELVMANGDIRNFPVNQAHRRWNEEPPIHDEITKSTRIVSGRYAKPGEAPYLVLLKYSKFVQWCGGAIYNRDTIVTAAHCFFLDSGKIPAASIVVIAGEYDLNMEEKTEMRRRGVSVMIPENYDPDGFPNDIAVLKLDEPLRYTYHVQPVPLAELGAVYEDRLRIGGFGYVRQRQSFGHTYKERYTTILKVASVPERTKNKCREMFSGMPEILALVNHETFYCAGGETVGGQSTDACQGDSGGPAVCVDGNKKPHLCGVISTGYGCGLPGMPGIFTNVSYYHDWIKQHGGESDPPTRLY